ncbi:hypothetical protein N657DRAFT_82563 [Parathielavia appendiculata]|uniref:Uncharacterized protein n=1 Tax=Parathielavia appendiculata TaxID=2587402 RepID=A0AAN6UAP3_9PEZI|nr:hypothetical protein N657DRAFT_82563 [Parathielavia appendiculata]
MVKGCQGQASRLHRMNAIDSTQGSPTCTCSLASKAVCLGALQEAFQWCSGQSSIDYVSATRRGRTSPLLRWLDLTMALSDAPRLQISLCIQLANRYRYETSKDKPASSDREVETSQGRTIAHRLMQDIEPDAKSFSQLDRLAFSVGDLLASIVFLRSSPHSRVQIQYQEDIPRAPSPRRRYPNCRSVPAWGLIPRTSGLPSWMTWSTIHMGRHLIFHRFHHVLASLTILFYDRQSLMTLTLGPSPLLDNPFCLPQPDVPPAPPLVHDQSITPQAQLTLPHGLNLRSVLKQLHQPD